MEGEELIEHISLARYHDRGAGLTVDQSWSSARHGIDIVLVGVGIDRWKESLGV